VTEPWVIADAIAKHHGVTKDSVYANNMPAHRLARRRKLKVTDCDKSVRTSGAERASRPSQKGAP
jgi:hypothetical protein